MRGPYNGITERRIIQGLTSLRRAGAELGGADVLERTCY